MDKRLKRAYHQCKLDLESAREALAAAHGGSNLVAVKAQLAKVEETLVLERARCSNMEKEKSHAQQQCAKLDGECVHWRTVAEGLMAQSENYKELAAQAEAELEEEKKTSDALRTRLAAVESQKDEAVASVGRLKDENAKA